MTDHTWARENIAAYVAGGLDAAETERLEAHAAGCADCTAEIATARQIDLGLAALFDPVRPGPGLEDKVVWSLRTTEIRRPFLTGWKRNLTIGLAASVGLGLIGATASQLGGPGQLPLPGSAQFDRWIDGTRLAEISRSERESRSSVTDDRFDALQDRTEAVEFTWEEASGKLKKSSGVDGDFDDYAKDVAGRMWHASPKDTDGTLRSQWRSTVLEPQARGEAGKDINYLYAIPDPNNGVTVLSGEGRTDNKEKALKLLQKAQQGVDPANTTFSLQTNLRGLRPTDYAPPNLAFFVPTEAKPKPVDHMLGAIVAKPDDKPADPAKPGSTDSGATAGIPAAASGFTAGFGVTNQPPKTPPPPPEQAPTVKRIVLRSGDIEFEVNAFDSAVATILQLVTPIKGAYVGTVNSEKLPNGKVKGSVTVRVPPENLDSLVLDLRKEIGKAGELKGQRIGSQDVTKQYTDTESRLKAARTMEQRLLQIIKEGKGEIKLLLEAEKELGIWRTKIEEYEGEIRYYNNLAALSTLTISLTEKSIRSAAELTESERVQAGVEVEDVDVAYRQALEAIAQAKGRVVKSELKQLAAGQFNASLQFETAPEQAGPIRDRLKQLGRVARLEIDRVQQAASGATVTKDAKVTKGDTVFIVQLYNLANIAPRETALLQVATPDVPAAYQALRDAIAKVQGRVATAQLNEQDRRNITAQLDFEVRRADEGTVQAALAAIGDTITRQVTRAAEGDAVTDAKVLYRTTLVGINALLPREVTSLAIEVEGVEAKMAQFSSWVSEAKGRVIDSTTARERTGRVTARQVYEVPLPTAEGLVARFRGEGIVRVHQSTRNPQATEGKYATARIEVTLATPEQLISADQGIFDQIRKGFSVSLSFLLTSLTWLIFGLCVVLPWAVVGYLGYRLLRWLFRSRPIPAPPVTA